MVCGQSSYSGLACLLGAVYSTRHTNIDLQVGRCNDKNWIGRDCDVNQFVTQLLCLQVAGIVSQGYLCGRLQVQQRLWR